MDPNGWATHLKNACHFFWKIPGSKGRPPQKYSLQHLSYFKFFCCAVLFVLRSDGHQSSSGPRPTMAEANQKLHINSFVLRGSYLLLCFYWRAGEGVFFYTRKNPAKMLPLLRIWVVSGWGFNSSSQPQTFGEQKFHRFHGVSRLFGGNLGIQQPKTPQIQGVSCCFRFFFMNPLLVVNFSWISWKKTRKRLELKRIVRICTRNTRDSQLFSFSLNQFNIIIAFLNRNTSFG